MEQKDLQFVNPPMPKIEKQVIISIGREFGSGGHEIAERIAKTFNLPCMTTIFCVKFQQKKALT